MRRGGLGSQTALEGTLAELAKRRQHIQNLEITLMGLRREVKALRETNSNLQVDLASVKQINASLVANIKGLQELIHSLSEEGSEDLKYALINDRAGTSGNESGLNIYGKKSFVSYGNY